MGAVKTINILRTRYMKDGGMDKIDLLPTREQCKNYKRKHVFDNLLNLSSVNEALLEHMIHDKESFDKITDLDEQIYLG